MKIIAFILMLAMAGCAQMQANPRTVTITKNVPVYPPEALYSDKGPCAQVAPRQRKTVGDLAALAVAQKYVIEDCVTDRAALRKWRSEQ